MILFDSDFILHHPLHLNILWTKVLSRDKNKSSNFKIIVVNTYVTCRRLNSKIKSSCQD